MSDLSPDLRAPAQPPMSGSAAPWWLRLRRSLVDGVAWLRRGAGSASVAPLDRGPPSGAATDPALGRHPGLPRPHGARSQAAVDMTPEALDDQRQRASVAYHDGLTGLPNRQRFERQLGGRWRAVCEGQGQPFALLLLEIERLPCVDGPQDATADLGDEAFLVAAARRIEHSLRPADTVARLSGGRFAILAVDPDGGHGVFALAARLQSGLQRPFRIGGREVGTGTHIGVARSGSGSADAVQLLREAEAGLARARALGPARPALADAALADAALSDAPLSDAAPTTDALKEALEGALTLDYEPVFELASGRIVGFEALPRWKLAERGLVTAQDRLPPALTDQVLPIACRQCADWHALGGPFATLVLSVNLADVDLADPGLVARVQGALAESGLAPELLMLELAENTLMQGLDGALPVLAALREAGIALSVDGFGAGASSLRHLASLPVSGLKIAPAFVADLASGENGENGDRADSADSAQAIMHALVMMAEAVAKSVAAEGIETAEQLERLQMAGCTAGQGGFLSRPLTAAQVGQLLDHLMDQPLRLSVAHRDTARAMFG